MLKPVRRINRRRLQGESGRPRIERRCETAVRRAREIEFLAATAAIVLLPHDDLSTHFPVKLSELLIVQRGNYFRAHVRTVTIGSLKKRTPGIGSGA